MDDCTDFPKPLLVDFLQCTCMANFLEILFRVTGGFCIDGKGSLILRESYFVRIFTICKWFHRSRQRLYLGYSSHKKTAKNIENHHRSFKEYRFDF
jgi:hypothetical protein